MIELAKILNDVDVLQKVGPEDIKINALQFDSRKIKEGDVFFAMGGTQVDGHQFINKSIDLGAKVVVCERLPEELDSNIAYILVSNSAKALGIIASNFYGNPTRKLKVIGVTGTNGKTTIATILFKLVKKLGDKAGLLSTISYIINDNAIDASHTTPDSLVMQQLFARMVEEQCEYCFMEVSSHAVVQNRISGIHFSGGIYTNLTHDHLDYHKTFDEYIKAKKGFFDGLPGEAFALINADDKNGKIMVQNTNAVVKTYSLKALSDYKARIIESHFDGTNAELDGIEFWTSFIGSFNIYNLLAVYACADKLGFKKSEIIKELSGLKPVEGRFEYLRSDDGKTAIVDYAHTPDALVNVLNTINQIKSGSEKVITVVGAGGNRDKLKRPKMAIAAINNSDKVIFTSDNPRDEEPDAIIKDMIDGVDKVNQQKFLAITDRKEAIKAAIMMADSKDIILVAGKGHETYQEIKGERYHFDDREVIHDIFMKK